MLLLFSAEYFFSSLLSKNIKTKLFRTVILPVVLYGCETWSPTVSEEHRLRVFGNRVLRKMFGPMRDEVMGEWGRQHNETLYDLYAPNIWVIESRMKWVGHVAHMGKRRGAYRILVGRPEGRILLGRPRHTWWDDIKMDLWGKALTTCRLIWLMTGTVQRFFCMQQLTCGLTSQERHVCMKLVYDLCRKYCFGKCVSSVRGLCICQSVTIRYFFYVPRKC